MTLQTGALVGRGDAALGESVLTILDARGEPMMRLRDVTDELGREATGLNTRKGSSAELVLCAAVFLTVPH